MSICWFLVGIESTAEQSHFVNILWQENLFSSGLCWIIFQSIRGIAQGFLSICSQYTMSNQLRYCIKIEHELERMVRDPALHFSVG